MGRHAYNFDWITLLLIVCIISFSLFLLLSLGYGVFWQQLLFGAIAIFLAIGLSRIHPVILWWFAPIGYVFGVILLFLSYLGPNVRGATRWIMVAGQQLQPSELAKPLFLLAFSYFFTKYPPRSIRFIPMHCLLFSIPFLLVLKQPDLGSAIIYAIFWISMMLAGGMSIWIIISAAGIGIFSLPALWHMLLPYQKDRIVTFLNPSHDPSGTGYNALQAMIAIGSGMIFGRGLGRGTQSHLQFLPEHHTDFIFATLIEELGFVGGAVLLILYGLLLLRIIGPQLKNSDNPAIFVFSLGLFGMLLGQIFINTAMNMGIIPITGITLPFVSYGGSSLLSLGITFGLLWALQKEKVTG